jgi:acetylglutamate kinase
VSIFNEISSANLKLDLNGVGDFHHINRAGVKIELTAPTVPVIQPYADGSGLYVINLGDNWTVYATFDDFASALLYPAHIRIQGEASLGHGAV